MKYTVKANGIEFGSFHDMGEAMKIAKIVDGVSEMLSTIEHATIDSFIVCVEHLDMCYYLDGSSGRNYEISN